MLKLIPTTFMRCRICYESAYRLSNPIRFYGKFKADENYFKSIIKTINKNASVVDDGEKLNEEYEKLGKMPVLDDKKANFKEGKFKQAVLDDDHEDDVEEEENGKVEKNKRLSAKEKFKQELHRNRENEKKLKKIYNDYVQETERKTVDQQKDKPSRMPKIITKRRVDEKNEENFDRERKTDKSKSKKKFNKFDSEKQTPYEKEIFERDRQEREINAEQVRQVEDKTVEISAAENEPTTTMNRQRYARTITKLGQFYEYDNENKKFKDVYLENRKNENSLVPTDKSNDLMKFEEINEIESIEERIKNLKPSYRPFVYNLAYFVNDSKTLQKFIEMGVEIQHWDKDREICEFILKLDFDKNIAPYLIFLHDLGIKPDGYAYIILKNPLLFKESLDNLKIRIQYLESKKFTKDDIASIITKAPKWLSLTVEEIDRNLGWYQNEFKLNGAELRAIITEKPKLCVIPLKIATDMKFCFKEFLSYSDDDIKTMIKKCPKLFTKNFKLIKTNYNYLIDVMKINDANIVDCPEILYMPFVNLRSRFSFLKHLSRNQFDPSQPNFVSLKDICFTDDIYFCKKIAKSSIEDYEKFLKSI